MDVGGVRGDEIKVNTPGLFVCIFKGVIQLLRIPQG